MQSLAFPAAVRLGLGELATHGGVFAAYYAAVQLGMNFVLPVANVSLVWPAAGVALAAVWLLGLRFAVAVAAAAFAAQQGMGHGVLPAFAVGAGAGGAALLGAVLLRRSGFSARLARLDDVLRLFVYGALASSVVSSLTGSGVMWLAGLSQWQGFGSLWWVCWVADLMGILLVAPVILAWSVAQRPRMLGGRGLAERAALLLTLLVSVWTIYADVLPAGIAMAQPLSYSVFPIMIWAAVRTMPGEMALLLLIHAAVAIGYTAVGGGPFTGATLREDLLSLHGHLGLLSVTMLMLAAVMAERRDAEAALRESEAKYRLLIENQTDLVVKMDAEGRIVFASPTVAEACGQPLESLIGRPFRLLLGASETDELNGAWESVFRPPWSCYLERPMETPQGQRWLAWAGKAILDYRGQPCAVVAVGRDVTERRQAEEDSREYLQELAHVGRISAMGEMAAGLAHELNQPLCAITTYSQACLRLLGPDSESDLRRAIERVAANSQRAGEIIRQMRTFVRKEHSEVGPVDVDALLRDVLELTSAEARQADVRIRKKLAGDLPAVNVAAIQIHQVLVNLIRNAVDALRERPRGARTIDISTTTTARGGVAVTVADNGPGLPAELMDNLFEPFVTGKTDGMGLGLSISRSIVENHGGRLTAANRPQGGAVFRFELPAAEESGSVDTSRAHHVKSVSRPGKARGEKFGYSK